MYRCPICQHKTVPVMYTLTPQAFQKPLNCGVCGSAIVQVHGWRDLVAIAPITLTGIADQYAGEKPNWYIWLVLGLALLLGQSLAVHFVRFKAVPRQKGERVPVRP